MKVLILGGGVIGVTSAWYLARAGHEVTLVERQPEVALETSFANAGMLSFDYSTMNRFCPQIPVLVKIYSECAVRPGMGLL